MSNDRKLSDIKVGGSEKPQRLPKPRIMGENGGQDRLGALPAPVGLLLGKNMIDALFKNPKALWAANGSGPSEPRGNGTKEKDAGVGGSVDTDPDLDSGIDTDTEVDDWEPNSDVGMDGGLDVDTDSDTDSDSCLDEDWESESDVDTDSETDIRYRRWDGSAEVLHNNIGISAVYGPSPRPLFLCDGPVTSYTEGRLLEAEVFSLMPTPEIIVDYLPEEPKPKRE